MQWLYTLGAGLWPLVWHFGLAGLMIAGCAAGVYFAPTIKSKLWFVAIGAIIITFSIAVAIGVTLGENRVRSQWNAALANETENGEQARTDAVDTVGPVSASRELLRSDPFNRNRGEQPARK
jgi:hypothetical protein